MATASRLCRPFVECLVAPFALSLRFERLGPCSALAFLTSLFFAIWERKMGQC